MSSMKVVKNCETCGHSEMRGLFVRSLYCKMSLRSCVDARRYPALSNCRDDFRAWVPDNLITVSFDDAKKMETWEKLNNA